MTCGNGADTRLTCTLAVDERWQLTNVCGHVADFARTSPRTARWRRRE
jgi:hypothetical protein